jgi:hypothetical protein
MGRRHFVHVKPTAKESRKLLLNSNKTRIMKLQTPFPSLPYSNTWALRILSIDFGLIEKPSHYLLV